MAVKSIRAHDVASDSHVRRPPSRFSLKPLRASLLATAAICAVMALPHPASAQSPTGGNVVAGTAGISQSGLVTSINQSSQKAIINWQGFSVGAQNTVNFNQPSSSSATLNRVIGNESSVINGAINANGQVFIVNSNGVLFGKGSQVNVGGLVASTLDISNNDFMAGNYRFSGTSSASVVNQGRIRAHGGGQGGGYVALLGKTVSNEGVIAAKLGTVAMASGEQITLNFGGDSLIDVTIDKGTLNALVQNKRAIIANGGQVIMTAKAADQVLSAQVNNTGVIQARTMAALKGGSNGGTVRIGKIKLLAQGGTTKVSGKLDASAPKGGDGGFIETSGDVVNIADTAVITTLAVSGKSGTWLIDPYNITISSSPTTNGSFDNGSPNTFTPTGTSVLNVAMLQVALANNNVVITTGLAGSPGADAGDINVNSAVTWSANTTLTLTAAHDININQAITASGANAGLVFTAANNININNAVRLDGASATLAMAYGGNYNIRTPASYAGTTTGLVTDKDGNPVYGLVAVQKVNPPLAYPSGTKASYGAPTPGPAYDKEGNPVYELVRGDQATGPVAMQDTSGGAYGSISFTNSANAFGSNPNGLVINGQAYQLIHSLTELAAINNVAGKYALATKLDAGGTSYHYSVVAALPKGSVFTGLGHTIDGLTISGSDGTSQQTSGLFGTVTSSTLRDLGLTNVNINVSLPANSGLSAVGALAGSMVVVSGAAPSIVYNVYSTGTLTAAQKDANGNLVAGTAFGRVGGLIGSSQGNSGLGFINTITNAFSTVDVFALNGAAGLIYTANIVALANVHATGNVRSVSALAAGLAGVMQGGWVSNSYATGTITAGSTGGGLIGQYTSPASNMAAGSISNSFATGDVFGAVNNGGLIAMVTFSSNNLVISNVYATGDVHANAQGLGASTVAGEGGLIGNANGPSTSHLTIVNAHAAGNVIADLNYGLDGPDLASALGGLVGYSMIPMAGA